MNADGHDLIYVNIEIQDPNGILVPDAEVALTASVEGTGVLAGFGSGNPKTDENYTDNNTVSFRGRATAIIRSGYEAGKVRFTVSGEMLDTVETELEIL